MAETSNVNQKNVTPTLRVSVAPFPYLQEFLFIGCTSSCVSKASLFNTFLYNMEIQKYLK